LNYIAAVAIKILLGELLESHVSKELISAYFLYRTTFSLIMSSFILSQTQSQVDHKSHHCPQNNQPICEVCVGEAENVDEGE
jgi:hypothetical protein